jgi:hypothetical protein
MGASDGASVVGTPDGAGEGASVAGTGGAVGSVVASQALDVQSPKIAKKKVEESLRSCRQTKLEVGDSWTLYLGVLNRL